MEPTRKSKRYKPIGHGLEALHRGMTVGEACFEILTRVIRASMNGHWYRILPKDGVYDDISSLTGIAWEHLLPLMLEIGLVRCGVGSTVKSTHVCHGQWDEMAKALARDVKMEVTICRVDDGPREVFVCVGQPCYKGPIEQFKVFKNGNLMLPHRTCSIREIDRTSQRLSAFIKNRELAKRVLEEKENVEDLTDEQIEDIAGCVEGQIQYALALDLDRRPRLSRTNAGMSKRDDDIFNSPSQLTFDLLIKRIDSNAHQSQYCRRKSTPHGPSHGYSLGLERPNEHCTSSTTYCQSSLSTSCIRLWLPKAAGILSATTMAQLVER